MPLTSFQTLIIVCVVTLGTILTRFLPFILFKNKGGSNVYINYLGKVLPYAAIGLLVVYCLRDFSLRSPTYGAPEIISIVCIGVLHYWRENTLLSIGVGTVIYMFLVQVVFI